MGRCIWASFLHQDHHSRAQVTTCPHPSVFLQVLQEISLRTHDVPGTVLHVGRAGLSVPSRGPGVMKTQRKGTSLALGTGEDFLEEVTLKLGCEGRPIGLRQGKVEELFWVREFSYKSLKLRESTQDASRELARGILSNAPEGAAGASWGHVGGAPSGAWGRGTHRRLWAGTGLSSDWF